VESGVSTQFLPICYKPDHLAAAVRELLGLSRRKLLLVKAGGRGQGQFGNPEEGERPPLEAATKQRHTNVCVIVNRKLWSRTVSKCAINPSH
jgi:hypothetical protein